MRSLSHKSITAHRFIGAWGHRSTFLYRRPSPEQWENLIPELLHLKRNGCSNIALLQALLDEGYTTCLSTIEKKLREANIQQHEISVEDRSFSPTSDETSDHASPTSAPISTNVTEEREIEHHDTTSEISFGISSDVTSLKGSTEDCSPAEPGDMNGDKTNPDQTDTSAYETKSVASIETGASLRSGCLRSVQESTDRTIETESNCPSMFGTMLQTGKRARKNLDALKREALNPRLPPTAPSPGQKVEEWHNVRLPSFREVWEDLRTLYDPAIHPTFSNRID